MYGDTNVSLYIILLGLILSTEQCIMSLCRGKLNFLLQLSRRGIKCQYSNFQLARKLRI
jgi:hypothetical protein